MIEQAALQLHRHRTGAITWKGEEMQLVNALCRLVEYAEGHVEP